MITDSLDTNGFAVEKKTRIHVKLDRANAKNGFVSIDGLAILLDGGYRCIQIWLLQIPKPWLVDLDVSLASLNRTRGDFQTDWCCGRNYSADLLSIWAKLINLCLHRQTCSRCGLVVNSDLKIHRRGGITNLRRRYISSPLAHVNGGGLYQP